MSEMWDRAAPGWRDNAEFVDAQLAQATELMLDAAHVTAGTQVLDLATGPGGAGLAAARRVGAGGRVLLADVSPEMTAIAGERAADPAISTAVFDQSAIAGSADVWDAVICRHGLMFAEDPVAAVAEAVRVLRPGGRYAAMTWSRRDENPWLGLILDAVGAQFGVPFPPPGVPGPFSLAEPDELVQALESGGLRDVTVSTAPTPMHAASVDDWWQRVPSLAGPLAAALAAMEPAVRAAIADRALAAGASCAHQDKEGITFPGASLIASGAKP
jgi:SAM-dependent methyltransferase